MNKFKLTSFGKIVLIALYIFVTFAIDTADESIKNMIRIVNTSVFLFFYSDKIREYVLRLFVVTRRESLEKKLRALISKCSETLIELESTLQNDRFLLASEAEKEKIVSSYLNKKDAVERLKDALSNDLYLLDCWESNRYTSKILDEELARIDLSVLNLTYDH